jgi:hypothetical protein
LRAISIADTLPFRKQVFRSQGSIILPLRMRLQMTPTRAKSVRELRVSFDELQPGDCDDLGQDIPNPSTGGAQQIPSKCAFLSRQTRISTKQRAATGSDTNQLDIVPLSCNVEGLRVVFRARQKCPVGACPRVKGLGCATEV